jgi:hypothetical protein
MALGAVAPSSAEPWFLDQIRTVQVGEVRRFDAAHRFKVGTTIGGRKLSAIGLNFAQHFSALTEEDLPATPLAVWTLRYTVGDASLVKALRATHRDGVFRLAHVYSLMEMGGDSGCHTDWRSNFAYVRSPLDRRLWAVHWSVNHAGEWSIGAVYVPHADLDWVAGSRLFSPTLLSPDSKEARGSLPHGE